MKGIDQDEVAVDAREIKHLFDGDEKEARLFIDRICSLGSLAHVDPPPSSVKELDRFDEMIGNAEQIVVALEEQMTSMDPRLLSILYPQDYIWVDEKPEEAEPEGDAKDEKDDDVPWKDELPLQSPDSMKKGRQTAKQRRQ